MVTSPTRADKEAAPNDRPRSRLPLAIGGLWAIAYGILGIVWLLGGAGYPFEAGQPGRGHTLLDPLSQQAGGTAILILALLAAASIFLARRGRSRSGALLAMVTGVLLAVVIPDVRILMTLGYLPIMVVAAVIGKLDIAVVATMFDWGSINLLVLMIAGVSLMIVGFRSWPVGGPAERTGDELSGGPLRGGAARTRRIGRVATVIAVVIPVVYASTRFAWLLGLPLGVSPEFLASIRSITPIGAGLATLGLVGAVLTTGLALPWGEAWPRWVPVLHGRPIPPRLPTYAALAAALPITSAGLMYVRKMIRGEQVGPPGASDNFGAWFPEMLWPFWGASLAVAALAYLVRRRPAPRHPAEW